MVANSATPFIKRWSFHSCPLNLVKLGISSLIENEPSQNTTVKGFNVQVIYTFVQKIKGSHHGLTGNSKTESTKDRKKEVYIIQS